LKLLDLLFKDAAGNDRVHIFTLLGHPLNISVILSPFIGHYDHIDLKELADGKECALAAMPPAAPVLMPVRNVATVAACGAPLR
jgi:hypothetical protein